MNVIVVDFRKDRREAVVKAIEALKKHQVEALPQAWGDEDDHGWDEEVRQQVIAKVGQADVVFLHSRNPRAEELLKSCYTGRFVVCYTAAAPSFDGEISDIVKDMRKYCLFLKPIFFSPPIGEIEWDLAGYFEEIEANRPDKACERLNQFDALLEAELNFLYECLDVLSDERKRGTIVDSPNWNQIKRSPKFIEPQRQRATKAVEEFASGSCADAVERLKDLRDSLLAD